MILAVVAVLLLMFMFPNVLLYAVSLFSLSVLVLTMLLFYNLLSSVMFLLILIVYVGAVMIFIGYVCAVCPNVIFKGSSNYLWGAFNYFLFFMLVVGAMKDMWMNSLFLTKKLGLMDFFLTSWGLVTFLVIIFMLFLTLLLVTSQLTSPFGPLRTQN